MNRFLTCTAVGLFLSLSPALAEPQLPSDDAQTPPAANQPAQIPEVMPDSAQPADPAAPAAQSSEAPLSIEPAAPKAAEASGSAQFLNKQASDDWLASNLIGQSVYNAQDENIGDINDLVTDRNGKIVAVLIGSGGFLGLGEKDVAVRFEDLKLARNEDDSIKIVADLNKETLASAPDYETLSEQELTVGSTKGDREDASGGKTY